MSDESMVERVKQAMLRVNETTAGLRFTDLFEAMARAAIEAMREPTEAMTTAGGLTPMERTDHSLAIDVWHNMIDVALSGEP